MCCTKEEKKNVFVRIMCVLCTGTCIPWYRVSWCTKRGAPNSGQKNVFGIEEYFDISPKNSGNGYNISIYRILRYRMIGDTKYDITIYRDVSCDTTPDHLETPGVNTNSTKTHYLVAVYSCFFRLCLCPHLGCVRQAFFAVLLLSISWTHHKTDRITSKQQPCAL